MRLAIKPLFILPINEDGYIGRRPYVIATIAIINALALAATYIRDWWHDYVDIAVARAQIRERGEQPFMVRNIKGAVHDVNGNARPNAQFELHCPSGEVLNAAAGAKGRFALDKLPDGLYRYAATRPGWQPVHGRIVVRKKTRFSVPIKIRMSEELREDVLPKSHVAASQRQLAPDSP
jgi:hypothetical protein